MANLVVLLQHLIDRSYRSCEDLFWIKYSRTNIACCLFVSLAAAPVSASPGNAGACRALELEDDALPAERIYKNSMIIVENGDERHPHSIGSMGVSAKKPSSQNIRMKERTPRLIPSFRKN